jgi:hypothetical protein
MRYTLGVILLFVLGSAQAALIDRGGGFIYDDVLDITWTQTANINGPDSWLNQVAWADGLSIYDSVRDVTWDDWRLPSMDVNGDGMVVDCAIVAEAECRDNEYGYLGWQNGISFSAPGPFTIDASGAYWSSTDADGGVWFFDMRFFVQGQGGIRPSTTAYAWAVMDGDVVPIPAAAYLFASGLGLLGWFRRRQTA